MRTALFAAPLLGLSLLGACAQPQYLLSERTDPAPLATTSDLREVPARYTRKAPSTATAQIVKLRIDSKFTDDERGKILSAVSEWNHVLNGAVRFDVVTSLAGVNWIIMPSNDGVSEENWRSPQPLVVHWKSGEVGVILVYVTRLVDPVLRGTDVTDGTDKHDLRGLMVHELGSTLGGGNGSAIVTSKTQDCISKEMAMSVAAVRNVPAAQLNWCEPAATMANR